MTGEYPRATDTFIRREVAALRTFGIHVQTFSVRRPHEEDIADPDVAESRKSTIYLLPPRRLIWAHLTQWISSPKKYLSAIKLAWSTCPPGLRGMTRQAAYFAEAGLLARLMKRHTLSHLHNNFADSSCSVAALAAEMGGFTFSFTIHGFREFLAHDLWWISEKIDRALFVNFISYSCRSLAMALSSQNCWEKLRIVHCGVDPTLFDVKEHRGDGRSLLYVGRLVNLKGLPILLEAIAKLQDATLIIAGEGPEGKVLQARATELGIADRVQFIGSQTQNSCPRTLEAGRRLRNEQLYGGHSGCPDGGAGGWRARRGDEDRRDTRVGRGWAKRFAGRAGKCRGACESR